MGNTTPDSAPSTLQASSIDPTGFAPVSTPTFLHTPAERMPHAPPASHYEITSGV